MSGSASRAASKAAAASAEAAAAAASCVLWGGGRERERFFFFVFGVGAREGEEVEGEKNQAANREKEFIQLHHPQTYPLALFLLGLGTLGVLLGLGLV